VPSDGWCFMSKKKTDSEETGKQSEQKKMQEKILMYQILQNHVEQLKQQAMVLERGLMEIDGTMHALESISSGKAEHETIVPLGSGCYAFGRMENSKNFLLDIGTGIITKKKQNEMKEFLEERKKEREKMLERMKNDLESTVEKINELAKEISEMQNK